MEMQWNLETVVAEMRRSLQELLPGEEASEIDLSYITQELLDEYATNAKVKDTQCERTSMLEDPPCFYGHSIVINRNQVTYKNNNSDNGCDTIYHMCSPGNYTWTVTISSYQRRDCIAYPGSFRGWS